MTPINVKFSEISTRVIFIGFEGEQNHTQVVFTDSPTLAEYPDATVTMTVKPSVGDIYPKEVTKAGTSVIWNVSASDCAYEGDGEYQITFTQGEEIIKTFKGFFSVYGSLIGNGTPPKPIDDWVQNANKTLAELDNITASANTLEPGSEATAEITEIDGHKNILIGVPAGSPGNPSELIDDTAGTGVTNKTWSADKLSTTIGNIEALLAEI